MLNYIRQRQYNMARQEENLSIKSDYKVKNNNKQ